MSRFAYPPKKRLGHLPKWFKSGVGVKWDFDGEIEYHIHDRQGWMDHLGVRKNAVISEPYGLCWEGLQNLVDVCRKNGWVAEINAESQHCPGHTIMITVFPAPVPPATHR